MSEPRILEPVVMFDSRFHPTAHGPTGAVRDPVMMTGYMEVESSDAPATEPPEAPDEPETEPAPDGPEHGPAPDSAPTSGEPVNDPQPEPTTDEPPEAAPGDEPPIHSHNRPRKSAKP